MVPEGMNCCITTPFIALANSPETAPKYGIRGMFYYTYQTPVQINRCSQVFFPCALYIDADPEGEYAEGLDPELIDAV